MERRGTLFVAVSTDESHRLERLLAELSARFTGLPVERIDAEIEWGLQLLTEFLGTDRSTISEFAPGGGAFTHIAAWARPGLPLYATRDPQTEAPWYYAQAVRGETLRLERLPDDFPDEAVRDRETVRRIGLKSNLTIPIVVGGQHVCVLATGTVREFRAWPDDVVEHVRLAGQILVGGV